MSQGIWSLAISLALGAGPYPDGGTVVVGPPVASTVDGYAAVGTAVPVGPGPAGGLYGEPLFPYDSPEPWMHGYFQEMPSYGGYSRFRPYNYKHVLSQSQVAGGWGMSANMPYSQQFWRRYAAQAEMRERLPLDHGRQDANTGGAYGAHPSQSAHPPVSMESREAAAAPYPPGGVMQQRFAPGRPVDPALYQPGRKARPPAGLRSPAEPASTNGPRFRQY